MTIGCNVTSLAFRQGGYFSAVFTDFGPEAGIRQCAFEFFLAPSMVSVIK